jgi:hypothetical protein
VTHVCHPKYTGSIGTSQSKAIPGENAGPYTKYNKAKLDSSVRALALLLLLPQN